MDAKTHLRKFAALAGRGGAPAVVLAGVADAAGPGVLAGPGGRPVLPAGVLAPLKAIAKNAAQAYGDWHPAEVTAVPTTHARALPAATGGRKRPPGDTPVYLVTLTGRFTGARRDRLRDSHAPACGYLSLVINARSFWVMNAGLSKAPPVSPATLGPVTNIAW